VQIMSTVASNAVSSALIILICVSTMLTSYASVLILIDFFFSSRRRHTRSYGDWSSDVCSSDLLGSRDGGPHGRAGVEHHAGAASDPRRPDRGRRARSDPTPAPQVPPPR